MHLVQTPEAPNIKPMTKVPPNNIHPTILVAYGVRHAECRSAERCACATDGGHARLQGRGKRPGSGEISMMKRVVDPEWMVTQYVRANGLHDGVCLLSTAPSSLTWRRSIQQGMPLVRMLSCGYRRHYDVENTDICWRTWSMIVRQWVLMVSVLIFGRRRRKSATNQQVTMLTRSLTPR